MEERVKWMKKYANVPRKRSHKKGKDTDEFLERLVSPKWRYAGCAFEYCNNEYVYLCFFE